MLALLGYRLSVFALILIFRDLQGATETEEWQQEFAATLRRNGCSDNRAVSL